MSIDRIVLAFAGAMTLLGVALGYFINPFWFLLAAFMGLNLFQAAFTGVCPLSFVLKRSGVRVGPAFH